MGSLKTYTKRSRVRHVTAKTRVVYLKVILRLLNERLLGISILVTGNRIKPPWSVSELNIVHNQDYTWTHNH